MVRLIGAADISTESILDVETNRLAASAPRRLIFDLERLLFLSSLAIGQLVATARSIRAHGGVVALARPNRNVAEVLRRCGMDQVFAIGATVEEAIAATGEPRAPARSASPAL